MTIDDALTAIRALHFAACLVASGTVFVMAAVVVPAARASAPEGFGQLRRSAALLALGALALAILSGGAWLALVSAQILGVSPTDAVLSGGIDEVFTATRFGTLAATRLGLALALAPLVAYGRLTIVQISLAAAFLMLLALAGHAGATPGPAGDIHRAADMAHLLAAGAWLGGLPAFILSLAAAGREGTKSWQDFLVAMTRHFSILGVLCVAILPASGVVNSWYLLSGLSDLWTTDYGRIIALKIGLFALMIAIAAYNKFRLTPRLPGQPALDHLEWAVWVETTIGLCVVLAVAVAGKMEPTAHGHPQPVDIPPEAAFVHIHDADAMADVTVDPGHVGRANVTIRVSREDFTIYPATVVTLTLDPPETSEGRIERSASEQNDGTWTVNGLALARAGKWIVRVKVMNRSGQAIVLDAPIVIDR